MWPQIILLEHDPEFAAQAVDLGKRTRPATTASIKPRAYRLALQINLAGIWPLQVIHATQKRALTRSTRSNDAHYIAAVHIERHAAQYLERPKALVDLSNTDAWNCTHDPVDATP